MKTIAQLICVLFTFLLNMDIFAQSTGNVICNSSQFDDEILKLKLHERFIPINHELATSQIDRFEQGIKSKFINYCDSDKNPININASALQYLIDLYRDNLDFTHLQIQLSEVPSSLETFVAYYKNNPKKLHLLFYAYNGYERTLIDGRAYDLTKGVVQGNLPYCLPMGLDQIFVSQYFIMNASLSILNSINPEYNNVSICGLQKVNVKIRELLKVLNRDKEFLSFDLSYGITNAIETSASPESHSRIQNLNNTLNLIFKKNYGSGNEIKDDSFYDLNDACPPGNCK